MDIRGIHYKFNYSIGLIIILIMRHPLDRFYFFDQVLPNMASIPDITAISYDVCGVVSMIGSGYTAKVMFFN